MEWCRRLKRENPFPARRGNRHGHQVIANEDPLGHTANDAEDRIVSHPGYRRLGQWPSCTVPDLDESAEFRTVTIYTSSTT